MSGQVTPLLYGICQILLDLSFVENNERKMDHTLNVRMRRASNPPNKTTVPKHTRIALVLLYLLLKLKKKDQQCEQNKFVHSVKPKGKGTKSNSLVIIKNLTPTNKRKEPEYLRLNLQGDIDLL